MMLECMKRKFCLLVLMLAALGASTAYGVVFWSDGFESDDPFNDSKRPIAALEAMSSARPVGRKTGGAIPVCSDHLVYRGTVNNRGNGFLVKDDEWFDALDMLVSDDVARGIVSVKGHSWVRKNADIKDHAEEWRSVYAQIAGG